ncbi:MAG: NAD-dependent epimerase/dehydratase family protein [Proteobacteria bacterium]|nr:NAD-dependent epimerase/dehydratase family protein [Pseudomonadota bacterium]
MAGERELRRLSAELGTEYVILRPTSVYGPRDERLLKMFRSAARGRFPLFGSGDGRRHMVYVTDLRMPSSRPACIAAGRVSGIDHRGDRKRCPCAS